MLFHHRAILHVSSPTFTIYTPCAPTVSREEPGGSVSDDTTLPRIVNTFMSTCLLQFTMMQEGAVKISMSGSFITDLASTISVLTVSQVATPAAPHTGDAANMTAKRRLYRRIFFIYLKR